MRITLTIDDDLLDKAKTVAAKLRAPFRRVVNEAPCNGLQMIETTEFALSQNGKELKMQL